MKNLQNLGKALSKAEQKEINGGLRPEVITDDYVCHPSSRFTPTTCPGGTVYKPEYDACCYGIVSQDPPVELDPSSCLGC